MAQKETRQARHNEATCLAFSEFKDPEGAIWHVTLREGVDGAQVVALLDNAHKLSAFLLDHGWEIPGQGKRRRRGDGDNDTKWCEIHQAPMHRRQRNGETWFSHKARTKDGTEYWCRGQAK